jgi:CSLREA domain-containing protein
LTVTSTADAPDAHPGDGVCATSGGQCTLRAATQEADAQAAGSSISIIVPAGTYTLTLGTLPLTANRITLNGALSSTTTINGNNNGTVLAISPMVQASISGVTITGGRTPSTGGGIANSGGSLTLTNSTVRGNSATNGPGGGILNTGTLTLTNSTLGHNGALQGGGIANNGGALTVINSRIISNTASGTIGSDTSGGGISNFGGTVNVTNSTLSGNSAGNTSGGGIVTSNGTVNVTNSILRANSAAGGAAIFNVGGTLNLTNSTLISNTTPVGGIAGGIYNNNGTTTLTNSTLTGNAAGTGGGIYNNNGPMTLRNSTLSSNTTFSGGSGGGIYNYNSNGILTLTSSTLVSNTASSEGGGILNQGGRLAVIYSTLSRNAADGQGGGLSNLPLYGGTVALTGTILSTNVPGGNCRGPITEGVGFNLDSADSCHFSVTTDLTGTLPHLGLLRNNGGPTLTMALQAGSPAIDHGGNAANGCPSTDQRGFPRPDVAEGVCDMGAYESQGVG